MMGKCLVLLAASVMLVWVVPAAAQENFIALNTDKDTYLLGDTIVVWGSISTVLPGEQIQMQILYREQVVMVDQFDVASDGTFARPVSSGGSNWDRSGQYVVRIWYGTDNTSRQFEYVAEDVSTPNRQMEVADGRGGTFDLEYAIRGGIVERMVVDYESLAISVELESEDGGSILVDLPRRFINATDADGDVAFIVLADTQSLPYVEEDAEPDVRRISVSFPPGTDEILIIGTAVVPEFGSAVYVVLAVGGAAAASVFRTRIFS